MNTMRWHDADDENIVRLWKCCKRHIIDRSAGFYLEHLEEEENDDEGHLPIFPFQHPGRKEGRKNTIIFKVFYDGWHQELEPDD